MIRAKTTEILAESKATAAAARRTAGGYTPGVRRPPRESARVADGPPRLRAFLDGLSPEPDGAWSVFVPGEPKTTQTGSIRRLPDGRAFPVRRNTDWSNRIALAANQAKPPALLEGPLAVTMTFWRARPVSLPKRITDPVQRPDLGNLSKGLLDALEGIVYRDDAQVVDLVESKHFATEGHPSGVQITVREVTR